MASYAQQMQDIFKRYQEEVSQDPVDLKLVGAWATANKLWAPARWTCCHASPPTWPMPSAKNIASTSRDAAIGRSSL